MNIRKVREEDVKLGGRYIRRYFVGDRVSEGMNNTYEPTTDTGRPGKPEISERDYLIVRITESHYYLRSVLSIIEEFEEIEKMKVDKKVIGVIVVAMVVFAVVCCGICC